MAKILYVEDDYNNIRLVQKMFKFTGHDVMVAQNGLEGIKTALSQHPDLILMDINLPDIDGLEVTRRIRKDFRVKDIPIIALTAHTEPQARLAALQAGCNDYLAKPSSRIELLKVVHQYLKYVNPGEAAQGV
ncbi:MAG: response regulator [Anaerolineae bacterium]|nr:response regulator [Anaerolineae bacterium]